MKELHIREVRSHEDSVLGCKVMKLTVTASLGTVLGLPGGGNTWECTKLTLSFNGAVIEVDASTPLAELPGFRSVEGNPSRFTLETEVEEAAVYFSFLRGTQQDSYHCTEANPYVELWLEAPNGTLVFSLRRSPEYPCARMG